MIRDTEYWQNMLRDLTPFEFSSLTEALGELESRTVDEEHIAEASRLKVKQIISALAAREDIVRILNHMSSENDWCDPWAEVPKETDRKERSIHTVVN